MSTYYVELNISIPSYLKYVYFCYRAPANNGMGGLNPMEVDGFLQVAKKLDSLGGNNLAGAFASLTGGGGKGKLPGVPFHGVTSQLDSLRNLNFCTHCI